MKVPIFRIILLTAVLIVLVSVSGGIFAQAQTDVNNGQADQNSSNSSSPIDPNAPAATRPVYNANDPDIAYARPAGLSPDSFMWFRMVSGYVFHPRSNAYSYTEGNPGCIYNTANPAGTYIADLQLPQGAIVDLVRMWFYDTSASDSYGWLTWYDPSNGNFFDITHNQSSGSGGYGSNVVYPSYVVDNYNYALALNWRPQVSGSTMQLCGFRIRYWAQGPFFLPTIQKN